MAAVQVRLSLYNSDYFTVASVGTDANTFLSYIDVRANEVLGTADPTQRSQYAAVSFALNDAFTPNAITGLVPLTSVRVGFGLTRADATWSSPCEAPVSTQFASMLAQSCGPAVNMCTPSPAVSLADRCEPFLLLPKSLNLHSFRDTHPAIGPIH